MGGRVRAERCDELVAAAVAQIEMTGSQRFWRYYKFHPNYLSETRKQAGVNFLDNLPNRWLVAVNNRCGCWMQ